MIPHSATPDTTASAPLPHPFLRPPWVAGVVVGLAITVTASLSLAVVSVNMRRVLLEDLRNYLRGAVETAAVQIDAARHATFTDSSQTGSPEYLELSAPLASMLRANPDIRFAYSGLIRGDSMYFILDGDRTDDRAYVMQGDTPTAGELELARLRHTIVEREPSPTAWGVGIRAYAPLQPQSGPGLAYVGITMSADRYYTWTTRVYQTAGLGLVIAVLLAILVGARVARLEGSRLRADAQMAQARELAASATEERRAMEVRSLGRQKMEALGTLAGGVAHDFNNLLAVILGNAEMIAADAVEGSPARGSAEAIRTAAGRAGDVVRRILLFSRPEAEGRVPIALGGILDETAQLLRSTMPSSIQLIWKRPAEPVSTVGDASQLAQVLMNLAVNASQALPADRGTIEFVLDRVDLGTDEARRMGLEPGPYARIVVRDDGVGMTEEVRARIFEPFYTTKDPGKGSGLGLAVVEGVVRGHQGAIDVVSAPGCGSAFTLLLPAAEPALAAAPPAVRAPILDRGAGQRLLLLDDDLMVLSVEARVLRRAGYVVDAHHDAGLALEALEADPGAYRALVTDRTMPKLCGLEVARRARELNPSLPIVLVTGRSEEGDADSPNISVVLHKPADIPALLGAVRRAISGGEDDTGLPTDLGCAGGPATARRVL